MIITDLVMKVLLVGTLVFYGTKAVRINTIRVPAAVENGTSSVILDCDYSIPCEEQTGLVVHWFWNKHPEPVYQWIPHKPPQGLGPLRGRINLQYKVSNDPCSSHRAMEILNPSPQLSGEYRCKISTWDSEDTASSNMIVYVREQSLTVSHSEVRVSGQVNVTCHVQGIFPEPTLELTQADDSSGDRKPLLDGTLRTFQRNGLFDATLFKLIDAKDLRKDTTFECTAKLEGTPYRTSEKSSIVSSGSSHHSKAVDHSGSWISSTRDPSMQDSSNELWQSTGRGIRAHDPPTTLVDSGSSVASFSLALFLLCASTIVVVSSCQLPLTS